MKQFVVLVTLISLAVALRWTTDEHEKGDIVAEAQLSATGASSRIAPPINNGNNFFPNENGVPVMRPAASMVNSGGSIVNSPGSRIVNSGLLNPLAGAGFNSVYFPYIRITVDKESELYIPPGAEGKIIITLKNDGPSDLFLISGGDDKNFFQQFEYSQVQLGTGQTINVAGRIRVPIWANGAVATMNVFVQRRADNTVSQRQIYIHAKSESGELYAPWCTVTSVTKCDNYLDESICANQFWRMRVGVLDNGDSGLLSIEMKPDGRFMGEDFVVGTNQSVYVERMISCCTTGVDITATDVRGNTKTCRADQYTYYLRNGDIAAVVLGVVLLLILLVALCFLIRFCCRRRKSRSVNTAPLPRSKKDQK